jgi:glycosyltransferase 2 family protein
MDNVALPSEANQLAARPQRATVWLHRIGLVLGLIGVLFVCQTIYEYQGQIDLRNLSPTSYAAIVGLILVYATSNILLALAWHNLLSALDAPVPVSWAVWAYATSLIAKYVPGNIFQFAGRQALGLSAGVRGWPLLKSMAWELGLLSLSGAAFGILLVPLSPFSISSPATVTLFCAAAAAIVISAHAIWNRYVATAVFYYFAFLTLSGLVYLGTLEIANTGGNDLGATSVIGAYVVSWLAGLLVPGAPAGLGVREVVLLLLLSGHFDKPSILLSLLIGRTITILGDLTFFVAGRLVPCN